MALMYEAFVPALVFGHLYVALMVALMLLKFRRSRAEADSTKAHYSAQQSSGLQETPRRDSNASSRVDGQIRAAAAGWGDGACSLIGLTWSDVCVAFTNAKGTTVTVLQDQCGEALEGEMLAIMGPSGAGKSTLLDLLSSRGLAGGTVSGSVLVNGQAMSASGFMPLRAFVPQEDHFVVSMTALETVRFHAALDLPPGTPAAQVLARAQDVLAVMGMTQHQHTMVGGVLPGGVPIRGLSGGQKRRLNIAARIVAAPPVVFLDEPTSGLDSTAALKVMSYMKSYACRGHTIIATLHQPRAAIWDLLDKVLFVAGGRLMYLGRTQGVVPWFSGRLGHPYDPTHQGLPSDWVMDLLSPDMQMAAGAQQGLLGLDGLLPRVRSQDVREQLEEDSRAFVTAWKQGGLKRLAEEAAVSDAQTNRCSQELSGSHACHSPLSQQGAAAARDAQQHTPPQQQQQQQVGREKRPGQQQRRGRGDVTLVMSSPAPAGQAAHAPASGLRSWLHQFVVLLHREFLMMSRNPADAAGRMGVCMYVAVLEGLVFLNLSDYGTVTQSRLGCLFVTLIFVVQLPFVNMGVIHSDSWLLVREAAEDMYSPSACYAARLVINTALNSLNAVIYLSAAYGLFGLRAGAGYFWTAQIIHVFGHLILVQVMAMGAVVMPTQDMAFMLAVGLVAVFILFSNFLIRWQEVTWVWVAALRYISPLYYSFGSLVANEFKDRVFPCPEGSTTTLDVTNNGTAAPPCVSDGNFIVALYTDHPLGTTMGVQVAWWAGLHILTYLGMRWRIGQMRGR